MAEEQHPVLIHEIPHDGYILNFGSNTEPRCVNEPEMPLGSPGPDGIFASASLQDIRNVRVFSTIFDDGERVFKGLLIEYENGTRRAVGQCRLGVDDFEEYHRPLSFSYANVHYWPGCSCRGRHRGAHIVFHSESQPGLLEGNLPWEHYPMIGTLTAWFSSHDMRLKVIQE